MPLAFLAIAAACRSTTGSDNSLLAELNRAKHLWATKGIASYTFVIREVCSCAYDNRPIRINVRNNAVESRTFVDTGDPVPTDFGTGLGTVEELFSAIGAAIGASAAHVEATYDELLGFPRSASIQSIPPVGDLNYGFTVDSFAALE